MILAFLLSYKIVPSLSVSKGNMSGKEGRGIIYIAPVNFTKPPDDFIVIFSVEGDISRWFQITLNEFVEASIENSLAQAGFRVMKGEKIPLLRTDVEHFSFKFSSDRIYAEEKGYDYWVDYSYDMKFKFCVELGEDTLECFELRNVDSGSYKVYFLRDIFLSLERELRRAMKPLMEEMVDSLLNLPLDSLENKNPDIF